VTLLLAIFFIAFDTKKICNWFLSEDTSRSDTGYGVSPYASLVSQRGHLALRYGVWGTVGACPYSSLVSQRGHLALRYGVWGTVGACPYASLVSQRGHLALRYGVWGTVGACPYASLVSWFRHWFLAGSPVLSSTPGRNVTLTGVRSPCRFLWPRVTRCRPFYTWSARGRMWRGVLTSSS